MQESCEKFLMLHFGKSFMVMTLLHVLHLLSAFMVGYCHYEGFYLLTLSFAPGEGILAHVNSLHISLSSSLFDSHLLHGNMYFCLPALSSTSMCVKCHAAPNPDIWKKEQLKFRILYSGYKLFGCKYVQL